ncbi:hypothetical protein RUM44_006915 [Polyplax serrata]|uniref:Cytochrome c oxidase assembly factor 4 homolog, mitochondrial n=1 Tax=Polyplax serrata TaxID=468196 RepID=A0ABR1AZ88_POLSC
MTLPASRHDEADEDQLEKLMKPTGCLELHYKVQECIAETKDWRQCQKEVQNFRKCMDDFKARGNAK